MIGWLTSAQQPHLTGDTGTEPHQRNQNSAFAEAPQPALRAPPALRDAGHPARSFTSAELGQQRTHVAGGTFGDDLDPSVIQVRRSAGQAQTGGFHPHPGPEADTLTRPEITRLLAGVREVMRTALAAGGTSFDSLYVDVNGESGYFGRSLAVYGQEGHPCPRCGTPVRRDPFMNRSSYTCPRCQPRPRQGRW